jgi:membrane-bound inhibitor of C-type lysozyme
MAGKFAFVLSFLLVSGALAQAASPVATVNYGCAQGKTLVAEYFDGPTRTAPDGRPIPGGRVVLTLADGKKLTLPQTLSGSGIRYANEGETFVFWSKGDTAFVEEGPSQTVTYKDCVTRKKQ